MFKQYDLVKTTKSLSVSNRKTLSCGTMGTIVEIYKNGEDVGYHVEFTYKSGKTKALMILGKESIEPACLEQSPSKPGKLISFPTDPSPIKRRFEAAGGVSTTRRSAVSETSAKPAKKAALKAGSKKATQKKSSGKAKNK